MGVPACGVGQCCHWEECNALENVKRQKGGTLKYAIAFQERERRMGRSKTGSPSSMENDGGALETVMRVSAKCGSSEQGTDTFPAESG